MAQWAKMAGIELVSAVFYEVPSVYRSSIQRTQDSPVRSSGIAGAVQDLFSMPESFPTPSCGLVYSAGTIDHVVATGGNLRNNDRLCNVNRCQIIFLEVCGRFVEVLD